MTTREEFIEALRTGDKEAIREAVHCGYVAIHRGDLSDGIGSGGQFEGFIFVGDGSHGHGCSGKYYVWIEDLDVAEPQRWAYDSDAHEAITARVSDAQEALGRDEDDEAYDARCEDGSNPDDDRWALQRIMCEIARELGYVAVELNDEHGVSIAGDALHPDVVIYDAAGE